MTLELKPEILKTIRKARKISRTRLAREAELTETQVARLERAGEAKGTSGKDVIFHLSQALGVPAGVLAGTMPLSDADLTPAGSCNSGGCGCC